MLSPSQPALHYSQNFLKDPRLVARLIAGSGLGQEDVVLEIGPGRGILTAELSRACKQVIAVEKDLRLAARLRERFSKMSNVIIQAGDFLEARLPPGPYKVFANIPFGITSAIVIKLTAGGCPPEEASLIMQKEAADMYLGCPHESLRTVLLKPWFEMALVHRFRREDFIPAPRVDAVMLRFCRRSPPLVRDADRQLFRDFAAFGFTAWQPGSNAALKLLFPGQQCKRVSRELGINPARGPTSLLIEHWLGLFAYFQRMGNEQALRTISGSERRLTRQQEKLQKVHRTRIHGWMQRTG